MLGRTKHKNTPLIGIIAVFLLATFASLFTPWVQNTNALKEGQMSLEQKTLSYVTYNALRKCIRDESGMQSGMDGWGGIYISDADAKSGKWWFDTGDLWRFDTDGAAHFGSYLNGSVRTNDRGGDGRTLCNNILKTGLELWGYGSALDLLCEAGINRADGSPCDRSTDRFGNLKDQLTKIENEIKRKVYGGNTPSLSYEDPAQPGTTLFPGRYLLYKSAFEIGCQASPSISKSSADFTYEDIKVIDGEGKEAETRYVGGVTKSTTRPIYVDRDNLNNIEKTCQQIAAEVNNYADDYSIYRMANSDEPEPGGSENIKCATDPDAPGCNVDTATNCTVEGIGWLVCPVITFAATMTDLLWGWISNFLKVPALNVNTGASDNTMYIAWTAMRNIANVAFVIAFIIIVYSQLTGAGVSNYGVKKMLPRLIVAAILVNISYWVAAIAVDVSNIIGVSIYNVLRTGVGLGEVSVEANIWEGIGLFLLSGGTIAAGIVGAPLIASNIGAFSQVALYGFIVLVLVAALALIVAFLVLAIRQALIIMLIVLSPLAFVAMILPNTEKYFTMWRKSLTTLLIFFPLFAVLFGGSYLAGMIVIGSATQMDMTGQNSASMMTVVVGIAITVVPLFLTPLLIRFSSGILGQVAGMINNKNRGLIDRLRNTRNRKARLAMGEAINNPKNRRNPFTRAARRIQAGSRNDEQRQKIIDANNKSAYLDPSNAKGAKLAQGVANAELMGATLEAELKADVELGKERTQSGVIVRQKAAEQSVKATHARSDANFEELKSSSQALPTGDAAVRNAVANARSSQQDLNIAQSRQRSAESMLQQEYATTLQNNGAVAKAAGGIDEVNGPTRVVASAINAQAGKEAENIKAAGTVLKDAELTQEQVRSLTERKPVPVIDKVTGAVTRIIEPSFDMQAAAIQQAVASNDVATINNLWNQSKDWSGEEGGKLRGILADSLQSSGARPAYYGQGAIAALRTNDHKSTVATVESAIKANAYSPQKIASADQDELNVVAQVLATQYALPQSERKISDDQLQLLLLNAEQALTDPRISPTIGKNLKQIQNIHEFKVPEKRIGEDKDGNNTLTVRHADDNKE